MRAWLKGLAGEERPAQTVGRYSDEELSHGVDHETTAFVAEMSALPLTWIEFPLEVVLQQYQLSLPLVVSASSRPGRLPVPFVMTSKQQRHLELMLARVPALRALRLQLVPKVLDEDLFLAIYFLLTKQHLRALKLDLEIRLSDSDLDASVAAAAKAADAKGEGGWDEALAVDTLKGYYRCVCRLLGLPEALRRRVLGRLLLEPGAEERFSRALVDAFGVVVPGRVCHVPSFGCTEPPRLDPRTCRVLTALALIHGHLYAPQLPLLASYLCQDFSEAELFDALHRLLVHSRSVSSAPLPLSTVLLCSNAVHVAFAVAVLERLIELNFPQLHSRIVFLRVSVARFASVWFSTLFSEILSLDQVVPRWLLGGAQALQHIALAILFVNASVLTQCETEKQFYLSLAATQRRVRGPSLLRCVNAMKITRRRWLSLFESAAGAWWPPRQFPAEPKLDLVFCVRVEQHSAVLRSFDEGFVWQQLFETAVPQRFRSSHPALVYSSGSHGKSLVTLRRHVGGDGGDGRLRFLLLRCCWGDNVAVAGVVLLQKAEAEDGEMTVFSIVNAVSSDVVVRAWAGPAVPRPVLLLGGDDRRMVVADNALVLEDDLATGLSRPSLVFGTAAPLAGAAADGAFRVADVEVWRAD